MRALIHKIDPGWHILLINNNDPRDVIETCTLLDSTQTSFDQLARDGLSECQCFNYNCINKECYKIATFVAEKEFIIQPSKNIGEYFLSTRQEENMREEIKRCDSEEEVLIVLYKYYGGEQ